MCISNEMRKVEPLGSTADEPAGRGLGRVPSAPLTVEDVQ